MSAETHAPKVMPVADKLVFIETFGCQMNKLDSELVMQQLTADGFAPTERMNEADLILFNTCSVRDHAENRVRSRIGLLKYPKYRKDDAVVAVMGCMAQREGEDLLARSPSVDLVVGTKAFMEMPDLYREAKRERKRKVADSLSEQFRYTRDVRFRSDDHKAYVSIMRGCDLHCTYCIVPTTRGMEQSRPMDEIVREVAELARDGVREVTLLGQTVNSWGKQLRPRRRLADLLEALEDVPHLERVRFITSHPKFFDREFWQRMAPLKKSCRYIHVPVQHGADSMLKRMRRQYSIDEYRRMVDEARAEIPEIVFASDFIVGFPGETEEEYLASEAIVREIRFGHSYVFKYSPRPGTPAYGIEDDVPTADKNRRCNALQAVQEEVCLSLNQELVGQDVSVLVDGLSKTNDQKLSGRSDDHRICIFEGDAKLRGQLVDVTIDAATPYSLYGKIADHVDVAALLSKPHSRRSLPLVV